MPTKGPILFEQPSYLLYQAPTFFGHTAWPFSGRYKLVNVYSVYGIVFFIFLITVYLQVLIFFKFKYKYLQSSLNEEYMPEPHVFGYAVVLLIVLIPINF